MSGGAELFKSQFGAIMKSQFGAIMNFWKAQRLVEPNSNRKVESRILLFLLIDEKYGYIWQTTRQCFTKLLVGMYVILCPY